MLLISFLMESVSAQKCLTLQLVLLLAVSMERPKPERTRDQTTLAAVNHLAIKSTVNPGLYRRGKLGAFLRCTEDLGVHLEFKGRAPDIQPCQTWFLYAMKRNGSWIQAALYSYII